MAVIVTVSIIGSGTEADPYRPNTTAKSWRVINENASAFDIEILEN